MASSFNLTIPHSLTRDEVKERFESGAPNLVIPGGGTAQAQWLDQYKVRMSIKAMGQKLIVDFEILEEAINATVSVPFVLTTMKGAIENLVRSNAEQMLSHTETSKAHTESRSVEANVPADVRRVHESAVVIDAVCPLASEGEHLNRYRKGGVTVVTPTIAAGPEDAITTLKKLGFWHGMLSSRSDLLAIRTAADVLKAKETGKLGILLAFQGADAIHDDVDLIDAYKGLGVGIIQLTYNAQNRIGCGCEVENDTGLTEFGREVVERMNAARVIVDCSHTGYRTSRNAIDASSAPVIFTHANPHGVHPIRRNIKDDLIKAAAATGGVIGVAGYPPFVSSNQRPSLDDLLKHITYLVDLVGVDHVGLGLDYFTGQDGIVTLAEAQATYDFMIKAGVWSADNYGPPPYIYPQRIETPDTLPNLTAGLLARGFSEEEVRKILGANWLRVFEAVWG